MTTPLPVARMLHMVRVSIVVLAHSFANVVNDSSFAALNNASFLHVLVFSVGDYSADCTQHWIAKGMIYFMH